MSVSVCVLAFVHPHFPLHGPSKILKQHNTYNCFAFSLFFCSGIGNLSDQSLCVMAPLFRLLRSLQFRIANNLDSVDGLLGCSVAMPKDMANLINDFPELNRDEQIFVLDSLFYCINWFREIVNAFSFLCDPEMQIKVILKICK